MATLLAQKKSDGEGPTCFCCRDPNFCAHSCDKVHKLAVKDWLKHKKVEAYGILSMRVWTIQIKSIYMRLVDYKLATGAARKYLIVDQQSPLYRA